MRVYKNETYIQRRSKAGQVLFWAALGVLMSGMFATWRWPQYTFVPLVALVAGFVMAQLGTYYLNRFVRPDRPDISLTQALKGFSDKFALYHYLTPAAHVLLSPEGCYVFVVKLQSGRVIVESSRGSQPLTLGRLITIFGQESVGNLEREAQTEVNAMQRYLDKRLPGVGVSLTPVVVFAHPNVQLDIRSSSVPVMHVKKLKDWLRGPGKPAGASQAAHTQLAALLEANESAETV